MHDDDGASERSFIPPGLGAGLPPRPPMWQALCGRGRQQGRGRPRSRGRQRGRGLLVYAMVVVLAGISGAGATVAARHALWPGGATAYDITTAGGPEAMNDEAVYNEVAPGIVDVSANLKYLEETAEGTGFVIDAADGLVLTNNHVIDGATSVTITPVLSGRPYSARVVGYDPSDDVALLQFQGATGLKSVAIDSSSQLAVGTPVLAIGNEAGQGGPPTIAPGIISGLDRTIEASDEISDTSEILHGMLQTSADIRPGDSGGPLADAAGQVVGIDTAAGGGAGYFGYAIPISEALAIAGQIAAGHASPAIHLGLPAFLGVLLPDSGSANPLRQASQEQRRAGAASNSGIGCVTGDPGPYTAIPSHIAQVRSGALVDGVLCGSAAASAGLFPGDVITAVGGRPVTSPGSLSAIIQRYRPGSQAPLAWVSPGGAVHTALVTLSAGPAE
jgi:S1-C subfamily serine protease